MRRSRCYLRAVTIRFPSQYIAQYLVPLAVATTDPAARVLHIAHTMDLSWLTILFRPDHVMTCKCALCSHEPCSARHLRHSAPPAIISATCFTHHLGERNLLCHLGWRGRPEYL